MNREEKSHSNYANLHFLEQVNREEKKEPNY